MKARRKWIHFFDNVNGIIFVSSLTCYHEVLSWNENDEFAIHEALQVFNEQINNPLWVDVPFFLFLTKSDLFVNKIKQVPITVAFPEYNGKQNALQCYEYIKEQFKNQANDKNRQIHIRCVSVMNKDCVEKVINHVEHLVGTQRSSFASLHWLTIRLIWIAFLKNDDNDKCLIKFLPKDVVKYIINLLTTDYSEWQL